MKEKIFNFIKNHLPVLTLILLGLFISVRNYEAKTFLTGWDTLHPEFNYSSYLKRVVFGAWQPHQGLGAVATQAHASEITRLPVLFLLDIFLPLSLVRYVFFFLCLLVGPLGVYVLLKRVVLEGLLERSSKVGAFLGALFYLLNLGTLQQFYVPLEMFAVHYALLPWLFYCSYNLFKNRSKRNVLLFSAFSLLGTSMAHTSTLWFVFFGALVLYLLILLLGDFSVQGLKNVFYILLLTFLLNSFWLLPNLYFVLGHGKQVQESKIHYLFSQEAFLQNKTYGNFQDLAILKGFLFSWGEHVGNGNFGNLLDEWVSHQKEPFVLKIGYYFFFLIILGAVYTFFKRDKVSLPFLALMLFSVFFLLTTNGPLGSVFGFFQSNVSLFREAFRLPFTKFSILLAFSYSTFFGIFHARLTNLFEFRGKFSNFAFISYSLIYLFLFGYFMFPVFRGGLVSPTMRVTIPQRYFDMFKFFSEQGDTERVANFPVHSFWGWVYYNWNENNMLGYQGAGFLWFGIKQPLLDREFDRWDPRNEQYYREISYALYKGDSNLFERVLDKYQVSWVLVDESVFSPGVDKTALNLNVLKSMLDKASIVLERDFGGGLRVYKVNKKRDLVETPDSFYSVKPEMSRSYLDTAYIRGDYVSDDQNTKNSASYPFRNIFTINESLNTELFSAFAGSYKFEARSLNNNQKINLPAYSVFEKVLPVTLAAFRDSESSSLTITPGLPSVSGMVNGNSLKVPISSSQNKNYLLNVRETIISLESILKRPEEAELMLGEDVSLAFFGSKFIKDHKVVFSDLAIKPESCSFVDTNQSFGFKSDASGTSLFARNVKSCLTIPLNKLSKGVPSVKGKSIVEIAYEFEGDKEPLLCILNSITGRCITDSFRTHNSHWIYRTFVDLDQSDSYFLRLMLDGVGENEDITGIYRDLTVSYYLPEFTVLLSKNEIEKLASFPTSASIVTDGTLNVNSRLSRFGATLPVFDKSNKSTPCSYGVPKDFDKVFHEGYVEYSVTNGFTCDHYPIADLSQLRTYLIEIEAKNVSGLPLRLCVVNYITKRCDLYTTLLPTRSFTKEYFILPTLDGDKYGYGVDVDNLSFGLVPSVNHLKSIKFYPVPFSWIQSINIGNNDSISNLAGVENVMGFNPFYLVLLSSSDEQGVEGLVTLNQSFEQGWLTWPPFKHVVVNNWSNGWLVNGKTRYLLIFFWPQILEVLGFFLIGGFFLTLSGKIASPLRSRTQKNRYNL
ncbi:MAG: hypothetical protein AAB443_02790 [Patescibacteria group bacterium]